MTEPLFAYRHRTILPGTQTGGCNSNSGGALVPNVAWPAEFDDACLFADYVCGAIFALRRNGNSVSVSDFIRNLGSSSVTVWLLLVQQPGAGQRLVAMTGTTPSFAVYAKLNTENCPAGIKISNSALAPIKIWRDKFHSNWICEILSRPHALIRLFPENSFARGFLLY